MDLMKRYVISTLLVLMGLGMYKAYQSSQHFQWTHLRDDKGVMYAIPSWRKD